MSTTTIEFTMSGDTATSVILSDAAATFGVKRTDTGAVVVAAGQAMTAGAGGTWTYTFTDPVGGLTYDYSIQYAFADGAVGYLSGEKSSSVHSVTPSDLEKEFGTANILAWADKDNTGDAVIIAAAIDYAQTLAGRFTAMRAAQLRAPIPPVGSDLYFGIQDFETTYAGILLYMGRGQIGTDQGNEGAGPYNADLVSAKNSLTGVLIASRNLYGMTGTNVSAPQAIASGSNVALVDRLGPQPFAWGWGGLYGGWPNRW